MLISRHWVSKWLAPVPLVRRDVYVGYVPALSRPSSLWRSPRLLSRSSGLNSRSCRARNRIGSSRGGIAYGDIGAIHVPSVSHHHTLCEAAEQIFAAIDGPQNRRAPTPGPRNLLGQATDPSTIFSTGKGYNTTQILIIENYSSRMDPAWASREPLRPGEKTRRTAHRRGLNIVA